MELNIKNKKIKQINHFLQAFRCHIFIALFAAIIFFAALSSFYIYQLDFYGLYFWGWFFLFLAVHSISFGYMLYIVSHFMNAGFDPHFFKVFSWTIFIRFLLFLAISLYLVHTKSQQMLSILLLYIIIFFFILIFELIPSVVIINWFDKQK